MRLSLLSLALFILFTFVASIPTAPAPSPSPTPSPSHNDHGNLYNKAALVALFGMGIYQKVQHDRKFEEVDKENKELKKMNEATKAKLSGLKGQIGDHSTQLATLEASRRHHRGWLDETKVKGDSLEEALRTLENNLHRETSSIRGELAGVSGRVDAMLQMDKPFDKVLEPSV